MNHGYGQPGQGGGRYDITYHKEKYEPDGSIMETSLETVFQRYNKLLNDADKVKEMCLIRVITEDKKYINVSGEILTYSDVSSSGQARLEMPKIDIEKTVKIYNDGNQALMADLGDTLTYTITIKNNSAKAYNSFKVVENIDTDLVSGESSESSDSSITIEESEEKITWNVPYLSAGSSIELKYRVKVKDETSLYDKLIVAKGSLITANDNSIDTSKIETLIGNKITANEKKELNSSFNKLKDGDETERDFINEVYKDAFNVDLGLNNELGNIGNKGIMTFADDVNYGGKGKVGVQVRDVKLRETTVKKYVYKNFYGLRIAEEANSNDSVVRGVMQWSIRPNYEFTDRARALTPDMLLEGDILLVYKEENGQRGDNLVNKSYIFLGNKIIRKISKNNFEEIAGEDLVRFLRDIVCDNYIILRPSLQFKDNYEVNEKYYETLEKACASIDTTDETTDETTITMMRNIYDNSSVTVKSGSNVILDLNGNTITKEDYAIENNGVLTITDSKGGGIIKTTHLSTKPLANLIVNSGTLTIKKGSIYNVGTVSGNWYTIINSGTGVQEINIEGGTISSILSSSLSDKIESGKNGRTIGVKNGTLKITGGKVQNTADEGYAIYSSATSNITITKGEVVNNSGSAIRVDGSSNKTVTTINGGTISGTSSCIVYESNTAGKIEINGGTINATGTDSRGIYSKGTCTIEVKNGEINSQNSNGILLDKSASGSLTITGGTIKASATAVHNMGTGNIVIGENDSKTPQNTPKIYGKTYGLISKQTGFSFYDGEIAGSKESGEAYSGTRVNKKPNNCQIVKSEKTVDGFVYKVASLEKIVFDVGGENYATLKEAYLAITDKNTTIKLMCDVIDGSVFTVESGKEVILDLNGYGLTKKTEPIRNNGTLTITDTSSNSTGTLKTQYTTPLTYLIMNSGVLNIKKGSIYNVGTESGNWYTIINNGTGEQKINIIGGVVSSTLSSHIQKESSGTNGRAIGVKAGTLTMTGGKVQNTSSGGYAIYSSATNLSGNIKITSGDVINDNGPAIRVDGESNGTSIIVEGGTIRANATGINNKGTGKIVIGINDGKSPLDTPKIYGKTYGIVSNAQVSFFDGEVGAGTTESAVIYSNGDVGTTTGYGIHKRIDTIEDTKYGLLSLVKANYIVGKYYYSTLADAYKATTQTNKTIKVMNDVVDDSIFTVESEKGIILDLNGKSLTKKTEPIRNNGTLTITDTSSNSTGTLKTQYTTPLTYLIMNSGVLNIEKGSIYNVGTESGNWYTIINNGTGLKKINLNGGVVSSTLSSHIQNKEMGTTGRAIGLKDGCLIMKDGKIQNISGDGYAIVSSVTDSYSEITIEGGEVINNHGPAISVDGKSNGTITTIKGGTISGTSSCIVYEANTKGKININGGTINATGTDSRGIYSKGTCTVEVKKGEINSKNSNGILLDQSASGDLIITGGTIKASDTAVYNDGNCNVVIGINDGKAPLSIPKIYGKTYGLISKQTGFYFFDGELAGGKESGDAYVGEAKTVGDCQIIEHEETIDGFLYTVARLEKRNYIVAERYYETLEDAYLATTETENTIKLICDVVDASEFTVEKGKEIILDLNGHSLTKKVESIRNKGTLTIADTVGGGTLKTQYTTPLEKLIINSGILNVEKGSIYNVGTPQNNWYTIINGDSGKAEIHINGGTISSTLSNQIKNREAGTNGRAIHVSNGKLFVTGGKIQNTVEDATAGYAIFAYTTESAGMINITGGEVINKNGPAISIEGKNNETRTVINGGTISGTSYGIYYGKATAGAIEISDGHIIGTNNAGIYYQTTDEVSSIKMTGGLIESEKEGVWIANETKFDFTGGKISINANSDKLVRGILEAGGASINMSGDAEIVVTNTGDGQSRGIEITNGDINVESGKITAGDYGILNTENGTVTVSGNTIITASVGIGCSKASTSSASVEVLEGEIYGEKYGIRNLGNASITIGKDDDTVLNKPKITGEVYGVSSKTDFKVYDGNIQGGKDAYSGPTAMVIEEDFEVPEDEIQVFGDISNSIQGHEFCLGTTEKYKKLYIKKSAMLTADSNVVVLQVGDIINLDFTYIGDGVLDIYSSGIINTVLEDDSITINGLAEGIAEIIITADEGEEFAKKTAKIIVVVLESYNEDMVATIKPVTFEYTGSEIILADELTVKVGETKLVEGTDYELLYENNIDVGTAIIKIVGKGIYEGASVVTFEITKAIPELIVEIEGITQVGEELEAKVITNSDALKSYKWWIAENSGDETGIEIENATINMYQLKEDDVGKYIGVTVTLEEGTNHYSYTCSDILANQVENAPLVVNTSIENLEVKNGDSAIFEVEASGSNLSYQWYKSAEEEGIGEKISGETSNTYMIPGEEVSSDIDGTYYYCVVSNNSDDSVESERILLTVWYEPSIITDLQNQTVSVNKPVTFEIVTKAGKPTNTTYKWQYRESGDAEWIEIEDATDSTYTIENAKNEMNGYEYRCIIGNEKFPDRIISNIAKLEILSKDIAGVSISVIPNSYEYTGDDIEPDEIVVKDGEILLKEGIDYEVVYENNLEVGSAVVRVTGIGSYIGTKTHTFDIVKADANVSVEIQGNLTVGEMLIAKTTTESDGMITYIWWTSSEPNFVNKTVIDGATDETYVVTSDDVEKYIGVTVSIEETEHYNLVVSDAITNAKITKKIKGDINLDGLVNSTDLQRLYTHLNGTNLMTDSTQLTIADVNEDGYINSTDLQRLYTHLNGSNPLGG